MDSGDGFEAAYVEMLACVPELAELVAGVGENGGFDVDAALEVLAALPPAQRAELDRRLRVAGEEMVGVLSREATPVDDDELFVSMLEPIRSVSEGAVPVDAMFMFRMSRVVAAANQLAAGAGDVTALRVLLSCGWEHRVLVVDPTPVDADPLVRELGVAAVAGRLSRLCGGVLAEAARVHAGGGTPGVVESVFEAQAVELVDELLGWFPEFVASFHERLAKLPPPDVGA